MDGGTAEREVTALVYAYAERIDAGDFAGLADLFADAELTFEGSHDVHRGAAEVLALYEASTRRYPDGTPRTKHVTTNVVVDVDHGGAAATAAATATARSYFTVLQAVPGQLALQPVVAGRYRDRFARGPGGWHFSHRHICVDLVGDLGHHLLFHLPPA
ncbi:MAG: nuclear transport factor 2 family protein [Acidimicrobiales bacterium]